MSNAKSRLRLIEPVRMFDEQRVNITGNCQRIRGYCLYSSARRGRGRGGERESEGGSAKSVGGSARNKRVAGGAANRSHLLGRRWRASRAIAAIYEREPSYENAIPPRGTATHGFQTTNFSQVFVHVAVHRVAPILVPRYNYTPGFLD